MNIQTPSHSIAGYLATLGIRLPLTAVGGNLVDRDGDVVMLALPRNGVPAAREAAEAFARLVNTAVAVAAPVPADLAVASAEA